MDNPSFLRELSIKAKILIIKQLANDLLCLYKNGFFYTDIKLENTLYKCLSNEKIKVVLGDVGSICFKNQSCTTTCMPYEFIGKSVRGTDKAIVWGLASMLLPMLYNVRHLKEFHWSKISSYSSITMTTYINNYIDKLKTNIKSTKITDAITLESLLHKMLELDPKKRISLKHTVSMLNNYI
jgi:serine/threonine protein kinase